MSRTSDNWVRLVEAVLDRERLRELALAPSLGSSFSSLQSDFSSRFSFDFTLQDDRVPPAPGFPSKSSSPPTPSCIGKSSAENWKPKHFLFDELKNATNNFQPDGLLGKGRFCEVFKGWIHEHTLIAVKKSVVNRFQEHEEWMTEVNYQGQLHHSNLVKLIGYCSNGDNRFLVYEFMPKGSLGLHLFAKQDGKVLSWNTRINVAVDIARGLCFLHDRGAVHGDVKASSILLDGDFGAKLSGSTLAMFNPLWGPLARGDTVHPRLLMAYPRGGFTAENDVYRFGVVLLELLCGRPAFDPQKDIRKLDLVEWTRPYLSDKRKLFQMMDTKLDGQYPLKEAYSVGTLALQCLSQYPKQRPLMTEVLAALEHLTALKTGV